MKRSYPNLSRLALALAVGTGLAACSVGPDYQRPQSPPPRVASEHLGEFSGERREAPWWSFFDDPQLVRLVDQALARNHDIREARANLRSARALFDDRWLDQLPQVTSQAGYSRSIEQQLDYDGEPRRRLAESYRAGFDAQWEIDLFGRLGRLSDAALARAEAADADLRLVRLSIAADTARAYFEIQGYQRRLDVARAQVRSWRDTLEADPQQPATGQRPAGGRGERPGQPAAQRSGDSATDDRAGERPLSPRRAARRGTRQRRADPRRRRRRAIG